MTPSARKPRPLRSARWWRRSSFASARRADDGAAAWAPFGARVVRGARDGASAVLEARPCLRARRPEEVAEAGGDAVFVGTAPPTVTAATPATGGRPRAGAGSDPAKGRSDPERGQTSRT